MLQEIDAPRNGDWIQTFTGRQFWPLDPKPGDIDIRDVAHALSNMCRYAGHCRKFYSVAEHSVLVSGYLPEQFKLWGLLHDASEAYLVDIPRPVKPYLTGYLPAEEKLMAAVCEQFGLDPEMPAIVKDADNRILLDEKQQNTTRTNHQWTLHGEPLGVTLHCWAPERAEREFISAFNALTYQ